MGLAEGSRPGRAPLRCPLPGGCRLKAAGVSGVARLTVLICNDGRRCKRHSAVEHADFATSRADMRAANALACGAHPDDITPLGLAHLPCRNGQVTDG